MTRDQTERPANPFSVDTIFFDRDARRMTVTLPDGKTVNAPVDPSDAIWQTNIAKSVFHWGTWLLFLMPDKDEVAICEVFSPMGSDRRRGRPIVYLDQNHWSTLVNSVVDPARIHKKQELESAGRLLELARSGRVVLPLSGGHMVETAKLFDPTKRSAMAVTMMQASMGWQMRHPLTVRKQEIRRAVSSEFGPYPSQIDDVFTLEPYALFPALGEFSDSSETDLDLLVKCITSPMVTFDTLLDPMRREPTPPSAWVNANQGLTSLSETLALPGRKKRQFSLVHSLADFEDEFSEAAKASNVALQTMGDWIIRDIEKVFSSMPSTRCYVDVAAAKHGNRMTRWKANDLFDMNYLSCAAGYADYLVGEKATVELLRQSMSRSKTSLSLHSSLNALLPALEKQI